LAETLDDFFYEFLGSLLVKCSYRDLIPASKIYKPPNFAKKGLDFFCPLEAKKIPSIRLRAKSTPEKIPWGSHPSIKSFASSCMVYDTKP